MNIQVVFLNAILYFNENLRYFSLFYCFIFLTLKPDLIKTLGASEKNLRKY